MSLLPIDKNELAVQSAQNANRQQMTNLNRIAPPESKTAVQSEPITNFQRGEHPAHQRSINAVAVENMRNADKAQIVPPTE